MKRCIQVIADTYIQPRILEDWSTRGFYTHLIQVHLIKLE